MDRENFFISQFKSKYIGDDGAVIGDEVHLADAFFEDIHFKREWLSLSQIAYKSVAVNVSDVYSMGAVPKYALLTVAIPKEFGKMELLELYSGFQKASKEFGFEIVGGDTISNSKLDISISMVGKLLRRPILRSGAKPKDLIAHTGKLGKTKRDLESLFKNFGIRKDSPFLKPKIRGDFTLKISNLVSAGLDISDGLFSELEHISKRSRKGVRIWKRFGIEKCSGEEYQFLFTFPKRNRREILAIAKSMGIEVSIFGEIRKGKRFRNFCKRHH